jgi:hypothetical protein
MWIRDPGWKKFESGMKKKSHPQHCGRRASIAYRYLELLALLLEFVELRGAEHISTGLHQFSNDVQSVVDGPVVVVNVILDLLNMEEHTN